MKSQINNNDIHWLKEINGKTIDKIFQVDYNKDRHADIYWPWLIFIAFKDFDKFLEIEGDFDGDHIRINLYNNSLLNDKLQENNFPEETDLWHVYDTDKDEMLGKLLGQKIDYIEYGIDKDVFEINGTKIKGQKDVFNFIRFHCKPIKMSIHENLGLAVSTDPKMMFEDTFDRYTTL